MTDTKNETDQVERSSSKRRRNWILGGVLAVFAAIMYFSIFVRLSVNPLSY